MIGRSVLLINLLAKRYNLVPVVFSSDPRPTIHAKPFLVSLLTDS